MSDPDIEKKRKKRRRSLRAYANLNRPINPEAASLIDRFPGDDDDEPTPLHSRSRAEVGKRDFAVAQRRELAARGQALPDGSYPVPDEDALRRAAILAGSKHGDYKAARKLIRRRAKELGVANPLQAAAEKAFAEPLPGQAYTAARVSPPIGPGHAAYGSGDHGAAAGTTDPMNQPGPRQLAFRHPSMRQGTTTPFPWSMMRTVNGDNQFGDRDITLGGGRVSIQRLDAAAAASGFSGPPANPVARRMDHIAPIGERNGTHSAVNPTSTPPRSAMKSSEAREILRRHMFPGSGGAR